MISPELLRRYTFFGTLDETQLKALAMISEEETFEKGQTLFEEGHPADIVYFLLEGSVSLYFVAVDDVYHPQARKEFMVGEIDPGEAFAISGLIPPYVYTSTAVVDRPSRVMKIQAQALRALFVGNCDMGFKMMTKIASAALDRLHDARLLLATPAEKLGS
jgi:CRP-like cAMP-binding protein